MTIDATFPAHKRRKISEREQRLAQINAQVADGSLVIRSLTAAERERYGPARPCSARDLKRLRPQETT